MSRGRTTARGSGRVSPAVAWTIGALGVGAAIGGVVAFGAPLVAKSLALKALTARGLEASIGRAHVGWRSVALEDVHARLEGTDVVAIDAGNIDVSWSISGAGDVSARTLTATMHGETSEVVEALTAWRDRHRGNPSATPSQRTIALAGVDVTWHVTGLRDRHAHAESLTARPGVWTVTGASGELFVEESELSVSGVDATIDRASKTLTALSIGAVRGATRALEAKPAATATVTVAPTAAGASSATSTAETAARRTPWPSALRLRELVERASAHVAADLDVQVGSVTLAIGDAAPLGPWAARARLSPRDLTFELLPRAAAGRQPLELRAVMPWGAGAWSATMRVGPATLAELGAHDGLGGLSDTATAKATARGEVTIDPDKETASIDGALEITGVSLTQPRLADGTIHGVDFKLRGLLDTSKDLSKWSIAHGAVSLGDVTLELDGTYERTREEHPKAGEDADGARVAGTWSLPTAACGEALASMPNGLLPKLDGLTMTGTIEAHGSVAIDTLVREKAQVTLSLDQRCRITRVPPSLDVERFHRAFELGVYGPHGEPRTATFGPGTSGWTDYEEISPYVVDALLTCEDANFFSHRGFSAFAIRNAMLANVKAGKFLLGASTLTMQLAKNLFLDRRKVLSRKLQEAVLTAWLEQSMSKTELLELYLNVVEMGPDLYGIGPAAKHYFGRPPSDLDPLEALFLVSILPSPVRSHAMWDRGAVSDGYLKYLHRLLREEHARGLLDDAEFDQFKDAPLTFHKAGDPDPAPRTPTLKARGKGDGKEVDDPAFDPAWAPAAD
ncbi:MAG: transglycosylase domain-containing protein [Polyangiales bacterium]